MRTVYRASAPASAADLTNRYGPSLGGLEERVAQALLNFERVWASKSGGRSRFSNGSFPVLYTATSEEVAFVEKGHWVVKLILAPMKTSITLPTYYLYEVQIDGAYREYDFTYDIRLVHPTDYTVCNVLGVDAVTSKLTYLLVPSARKIGGVCAPVFCHVGAAVNTLGAQEFQYSWDHLSLSLSVAWNGRSASVVFDDVFAAHGGV